MKLCRFQPFEFSAKGLARSDQEVHPEPRGGIIEDHTVWEISGELWGPRGRTGRSRLLETVRLLPPSVPSKIVCVGKNYVDHAREMGGPPPKEPILFLKPPSSISAPEDPVIRPAISNRVDYEGEIAVVIGRRCQLLRPNEDVHPYILGYTCLNDVTARDLQKSDVQFTRAKGFDTFCPVGPHIETELDPADVLVETHVNGAMRQSGRTSLMAYPVAFLVRWISRVMTLFPGDLIATGTPAGVGPLVAGDVVEISVSGVGVLRNPVQAPHT